MPYQPTVPVLFRTCARKRDGPTLALSRRAPALFLPAALLPHSPSGGLPFLVVRLALTAPSPGRPGSPGSIHRLRRPIPQRLVRSLLIVEREILPQSPLRLLHSLILLRIHFLVFHTPPQPLHEHVVQRPAPPVHADPHSRRQKPPRERRARKLRPLIAVEDLWPTAGQRRFQHL